MFFFLSNVSAVFFWLCNYLHLYKMERTFTFTNLHLQCENVSTIEVSLGAGTISTIVKLLNFSKETSQLS